MLRVDVFVPSEALNKLIDIIKPYAISYGGKYTHCISWQPVQSMWRPKEGASRYKEDIDDDIYAEEFVLTFRCEKDKLEAIISMIRENHPYEDVTIDVVELVSWF